MFAESESGLASIAERDAGPSNGGWWVELAEGRVP